MVILAFSRVDEFYLSKQSEIPARLHSMGRAEPKGLSDPCISICHAWLGCVADLGCKGNMGVVMACHSCSNIHLLRQHQLGAAHI